MQSESLSTSDRLAQLADEIRLLEGRRTPADDERVSTGCQALDALLPEGGLRRGALVEWLAARAGSGAATWALAAAAQAARAGGAVFVVDRRRSFYAPAAVAGGVAWESLIVVRPRSRREEEWALDQILRSRGVAAVVAWPERLGDRTFRRLQLAAASGGAVGLLIRGAAARREPSWAEARLWVEPLADPAPQSQSTGPATSAAPTRRFRLTLLRARGGEGRTIEVALDEERGTFHAQQANAVRLAAGLAAGAAGR